MPIIVPPEILMAQVVETLTPLPPTTVPPEMLRIPEKPALLDQKLVDLAVPRIAAVDDDAFVTIPPTILTVGALFGLITGLLPLTKKVPPEMVNVPPVSDRPVAFDLVQFIVPPSRLSVISNVPELLQLKTVDAFDVNVLPFRSSVRLFDPETEMEVEP